MTYIEPELQTDSNSDTGDTQHPATESVSSLIAEVIASIGMSELEASLLATLEAPNKRLVLNINSRLVELGLLTGWDRSVLLANIGCDGYDSVGILTEQQLSTSAEFLNLTTRLATQTDTAQNAKTVVEVVARVSHHLQGSAHRTLSALGFDNPTEVLESVDLNVWNVDTVLPDKAAPLAVAGQRRLAMQAAIEAIAASKTG